jgi:uncharacterized membrane protein
VFVVSREGASIVASVQPKRHTRLHPVHAVLLAGSLPLFLGALLSDLAYSGSYQVQWTNFASWLIVGGLVFSGFALLWALVELLRADRNGRGLLPVLVLAAAWVLGFIDSLVHAKDAWASMPAGLILSALVTALIFGAIWLSFSSARSGEAR